MKKKAAAKKAPAKKAVAKKAVAKKTVKAVAKKAPVKKAAAKKAVAKKPVAKKVAAKKPVAAKAKAVVKKVAAKAPRAVAAPVKKVAAPKPQTKTAERKAKRAAKAAATPVKKVKVATPPAPVWPPVVEAVLKQLDDAKAEQIVTMDLTGKSTIADTMVVASGRSNRHVNAIADQVVEELGKHGFKNIRIEGVPQCDWVLVDAGDVIVHVFRPEVRTFYNLEKLWSANVPE